MLGSRWESRCSRVDLGLVPALQAARPDRTNRSRRAAENDRRHSRNAGRNLLVVSEIALSLGLLVGAGLLIRSFMQLQQFDLGFNPDNLTTMRISYPASK